jgi:hypothetical protein
MKRPQKRTDAIWWVERIRPSEWKRRWILAETVKREGLGVRWKRDGPDVAEGARPERELLADREVIW